MPTEVLIRPMLSTNTVAVLEAILRACNMGVLLTDLGHKSLACNANFGEIFGVTTEFVVTSDPDGLRKKVMPLIADRAAWLRNLDQIYADPMVVQEDDLHLLDPNRSVLRRYSAPVKDAEGKLLGRLWTFTDVTADRKLALASDVLQRVSTYQHPDPANVYRYVLKQISQHYGQTTSILSILIGDKMEFRAVEGPPSLLKMARGNALKNAYCQYVMSQRQPVLVQDARRDTQYRHMLSAKVGLTRYLGVPVHVSSGVIVGTLCILDSQTDSALGEADTRLMVQLAARIGAEIDREAYLEERLADKQSAIDRQLRELAQTQQVLQAMNSGFGLLNTVEGLTELISNQSQFLQGILGYESNIILIRRGREYWGFHSDNGRMRPCVFPADQVELELESAETQIGSQLLGIRNPVRLCVSDLIHEGSPIGLLILASTTEVEDDHHLETHQAAISEQVSLLISTQLLHEDVTAAELQLSDATQRLVQSEKLGIVGALAASTAHDIRNILAAVALEIDAAKDPDEALAVVRSQLSRFSLLSHRLLSYAKPRSVVTSRIRLSDTVSSVAELMRSQINLSGLKFETDFDQNEPEISGDPHQLEHLFVNLIGNAIHVMPSGGGIVVAIQCCPEGVRAIVSDTGPGLRHDAEEIFKPFVTTRSNGFGLGLYSCRRIVEEHGGTITATQNQPKGTVFTVFLPNRA